MERSAVLVTGYDQDKLTNVSDGTGGEAGRICVDLVQEILLPERMKGLSVDTSASNTWIPDPASGQMTLSRSN